MNELYEVNVAISFCLLDRIFSELNVRLLESNLIKYSRTSTTAVYLCGILRVALTQSVDGVS